MIREGIRVTYVSHDCSWVCMATDGHDLVQSRMVNGGAGHEASSQRMPCNVLRVQSDACSVVLEDARNVAMVHRPARK